MKKQPKPILDADTRFSLTFNNMWALAGSIVLAASVFYALNTRITRLEDKLDYYIASNEKIIKMYEGRIIGLEDRQMDGLSRLSVLETRVQEHIK